MISEWKFFAHIARPLKIMRQRRVKYMALMLSDKIHGIAAQLWIMQMIYIDPCFRSFAIALCYCPITMRSLQTSHRKSSLSKSETLPDVYDRTFG